jgi:hypothetical protein
LILGERFGVAWEAIAGANNITDATTLRAGASIVIPAPGAAAPPTATATRRPASTPVLPTSTPAPSLAAVSLSSPADGAQYSGTSALLQLAWDARDGLPEGAQYRVTVSWVAGGVPQQHLWFTTAAQAVVPEWLWQQADQPERRYSWSVDVVRPVSLPAGGQEMVTLSLPGSSRFFSWN